jgi:isoaspartyl peptidase/L-asparaginase-like protein (Ntn-hydrolase superfamily)
MASPNPARRPLILSTWSFGQRANAAAWPALSSGGSVVDAVELACRDAEGDLANHTVGRGGFPDAAGDVSLDASIMLSPAQRGAVCFVRKYESVISIARGVMEKTPHTLLAGDGAERFAASLGMVPSALLTDEVREKYQQWLLSHRLAPGVPRMANLEERTMGLSEPPVGAAASSGATSSAGSHAARLRVDESAHDTIGVLAVDAAGTLGGGCTTSGLPYKLPGRVGDSPIVGQGLYVDPRYGAAVCTGRGELISSVCGAFLAVDELRRGATPARAAAAVIRRIRDCFTGLTDDDQVGVITIASDGTWAGASMVPGFRIAVRDLTRDELVEATVPS